MSVSLNANHSMRWHLFELKRDVIRTYGTDCVYCGRYVHPNKVTIDHYIPRSRGGGTTIDNCVPSCERCNAEKGSTLPLNYVWSKR